MGRRRTALLPERRHRALHAGPDGPGRHRVHCSARRRACCCPVQPLCVARRAGQHRALSGQDPQAQARPARATLWLWLQWRRASSGWCSGRRPACGPACGACPSSTRPTRSTPLSAGWPGSGEGCRAFTHVLTHLDWTLHPVRWRLPTRVDGVQRRSDRRAPGRRGRWFSLDEALALGLPAPLRKLLLEQHRLHRQPAQLSDALAAQEIVDQLQPDQRVGQLHQLLLGGQRDRQDLAPAVGDPAGVVEVGRAGRNGCVALALQRRDRVGQRAHGRAASPGRRDAARRRRQRLDLARPTARRPAARLDRTAKRSRAAAAHLQDAGAARCRRRSARPARRPARSAPASSRAGRHLAAAAAARPRRSGRCVRRQSADQVEVARLEHLQRAAGRRGTAPSAAGTAAVRRSAIGAIGQLRAGVEFAVADQRRRAVARSAAPASRRSTPSGAGRRCSRCATVR